VAKSEFSAQIRLDKALAYAVDDRTLIVAFMENVPRIKPFPVNIMMEKVPRQFGRSRSGRFCWFPSVVKEGGFV
jgi:hypothetical protein